MNQNIINQYQISFINKIIDFKEWGKEISKVPKTDDIHLTNFLINYNPRWINDVLLPDVETGLLDPSSEIENGSEGVNISSAKTIVTTLPDKFTQDPSPAVFNGGYKITENGESLIATKNNFQNSKIFSGPGGNYLSN
ncbi:MULTISPECIES: hypothetical protein [unclassified Flavobacterium]|uniref:hypothetical protein n=1 Tax=unclassified Flavobacterium TaxID=196869 RepID=UPI000F0D1CF7|nr:MULTISPECIES: hypothetical protein [unclassified Flavobacterium]AYN03384.1 hypothetical protein EAG11_03745 [Flavobacterium sp. 140616W15]MCD0476061.1 hypothetical protein [Flavobacterium sp. EDS]